ncbi:toxin C-terminal domain-containing protein [Streptomyces sp. NPDC020845]|uniref:toxin C-terminal domain-containing protein n=1 Tax=Streptomyces sp. NPDC020845 TaxID=3365096 RepID=UPI0037910BAB
MTEPARPDGQWPPKSPPPQGGAYGPPPPQGGGFGPPPDAFGPPPEPPYAPPQGTPYPPPQHSPYGPPPGSPYWPPPPPPPAPGPHGGARRLLPSGRRGRFLLFGGVGALILALVAGLLLWNDTSGSEEPQAKRKSLPKLNLAPFRQAVDNLLLAPGLRYEESSPADTTKRDITVTASGSRFGTMGHGQKSLDREILNVGGKTFTRWRVDPAPDKDAKPGKEAPGTWDAGYGSGADSAKEVVEHRPSPAALATELSRALDALAGTPAPSESARSPRTVHGTPALAVDTSAGRLLITEKKPHRVLRLEPYAPSRLTEPTPSGAAGRVSLTTAKDSPEVTDGPLEGSDSQGMDLAPVTGDAVDPMLDTLEKRTKELNNATDSGISLTLSGSGSVKCGSGGCTAGQSFTGQITTSAKSRLVDGKVTAVMSATFTIDGRSAGGCTSQQGTFAVTGTSVSGNLSCSNPGAGPTFASIEAQKKAEARARSRANGGRPVQYRIPYTSNTLITARALATVEVKRLVDRVKQERNSANCARPHSFPTGTRVLLADGTRRPIEDIRPGDRVTATDPVRGITAARPVTQVFTTDGDKDFTRITVATDRGSATLTATDNHPFWLADARQWKKAGDLRPGNMLRSAKGTPLRVTAVLDQRVRQRTYDLSVGGIHTYYVLTKTAAVLVHNNGNCNPITRQQSDDIAKYLGYRNTGKKSAGGSPIWEHKKPGRTLPRYITWDRTGHKGGIFKGANFKNPFQSTKDSARDGTYDLDVGPNGEIRGLRWIAK